MEILSSVFSALFKLMNISFNLLGFEISFWVVFLVGAIIALVAKFIWGMFD